MSVYLSAVLSSAVVNTTLNGMATYNSVASTVDLVNEPTTVPDV